MSHTHCLAPSRVRRHPAAAGASSYGPLFPDLPPFNADEAFLFTLGRAGGLCDCGTDMDDDASLGTEAAGWPFFGQFVAHDTTADRSELRSHGDPARLTNARSPRLDLDCLYGDGPIGHPFLFSKLDPAKLLTSPDGTDLQRNAEGTAIIGDPRNDSHLVMTQLQLAFVHAHNAFVDRARRSGTPEAHVFETAVRELRWHYQTAVLREFLPSLVGQAMVDAVLHDGRRYYRPADGAFIPLEFADAAYRYGHSQIRHRYALNDHEPARGIFPDLVGFRPLPPELRIDWARLFDVPGRPPAQRAKKIDGRLVRALIVLPHVMTGDTPVEEFHSLAVRDLERGQGVGLPSGEAVAARMSETPLTRDEVGAADAGWPGQTPLWYYILREADVRCGGRQLGPVGGRIVAEVLVGLLDLDPESVRHAPPDWQPIASLADLLLGLDARH